MKSFSRSEHRRLVVLLGRTVESRQEVLSGDHRMPADIVRRFKRTLNTDKRILAKLKGTK